MIQAAKGEKAFHISNNLFLTLVSLAFLLPLFVVLMTSFVSQDEIARRGSFILIPQNFDLTAYKLVLAGGSRIYSSYGITLFRVTVGTFLQLLFTCSMAYAISKTYLPGRGLVIAMVNIAVVFPVPLIPNFLLVKSLGLTDSVWSLTLPFAINSMYFFIMKAFFQQLPEGIEEAATIDGCNPLDLFVKIVLPLSLPSIATVGMIYAVWHWNEWFYAAIFINDNAKLPLQNIMRGILLQASAADINTQTSEIGALPPAESIKCAVIIISTLPILCVYPFIQKYFVKGFLVGGVKG